MRAGPLSTLGGATYNPRVGIIASALLGICLGGAAPADIQKAAGKVLQDSAYQRQMPGQNRYSDFRPSRSTPTARTRRTTPRTQGSGSGGVNPSRRSRSRGSSSSSGGSGGSSADLGNALIWMLVIVAAVLIVMWVGRLFAGHTKDVATEAPKAGAPPPAPLELGRTKTKAERLAEAGRFGDAIHVLLLETLGQLAARIPGGVQKSWTSREILRRVELPEPARDSLRGLVSAVEGSLFGHDVPQRVDFMACTRQFEQFADAVATEQALRTSV